MEKTIILNESKFKLLSYLLEAEDKNIIDARVRYNKFRELGDDFFKNPNLNDDVRANDTATYNNALKTEMREVVETIYGVYEKISHNLGALYSRATDEDPKDNEKVTYQRSKWMHPSTFYVENDIAKSRIADKNDFLYICKCY